MDSSRRSPFSPRSPRVRRVAERTLLAAVIAGSVLVAEVPASAQDPDELKERQEEVRADRRAAEDDLDVLGADLSDAQRALKATDRRIADVERKLAVSERDLADANRQAEEAASQQAEASGQVNRLRRQVRRMAVDSYLQPGREQMELLESDDLGTAVRSNTLRGFATGERQDVIDDFRSERQDLEAAEEYAVKAGERAAELRDELDGQAAELAEAEAEQQDLVDALDDELGRRSSELAALEAEDEKLDTEIKEAQARLAAELKAAREAAEKRRKAEAARAEQAREAAEAAEAARLAEEAAARASSSTTAAPARSTSTSPSTSARPAPITTQGPQTTSSPSPTTGTSTTSRPTQTTSTTTTSTTTRPTGLPSSSDIVTVGGISVHRSIEGNLRRLLAAAKDDGVLLGGSGYRSYDRQVATRRTNCGTSYYSIYLAPASSCSPPTAKPGRSQHQLGLAIDFGYQGRTICFPRRSSACQGNAGYNWLKANASRFGFYNLPSEAWHWSTTGN